MPTTSLRCGDKCESAELFLASSGCLPLHSIYTGKRQGSDEDAEL